MIVYDLIMSLVQSHKDPDWTEPHCKHTGSHFLVCNILENLLD